jgi:soluble lytic murein transglycosylase
VRSVFFGLIVSVCIIIGSAQATPPVALETSSPSAADVLRVLTTEDANLYSEIFTLQETGRWAEADRLIGRLENNILMGYVLHQRYMHPTGYRSSYDELKRWMAYYADHPEAQSLYALALKRRPKNAAPPVSPIPRKWRNKPDRELHPLLESDYANTSRPRLQQIEGRVRFLTRGNEAAKALSEIEQHFERNIITERQFDRMRSWIAASYYFQGFTEAAERIANEVAERNGETAVLAHWIGGLAAFRRSDVKAAFAHFDAMAHNPYQDDSLRSGGAFWAARTALATGRLSDVTRNLEIAAAFPFTFYGQLALAQLGREHVYNWTPPTLTKQGFDRLAAIAPGVVRAAALAQVGEDIKADLELRWANGVIEDELDYDLLAVAAALDLPAAQIDIALSGDGDYLKACLFPIPAFTPAEGFKTDRALLYALMRQESKFKVEATSRVGAVGLMQLMPRTASYVARDSELMRPKARNRLYDPSLNLELGQSYVNYLISNAANGNLFDMALAYNGGPGNLRRWKRDLALDDPLLFIESIPNPESRDFVEKVLTNVWIYYARLGQQPLTRDKVAAGELPLFEALDQIAGEER